MRHILVTLLTLLALHAQAEVGFVVLAVPDGDAAPIETGLWYPAEAGIPRLTPMGAFTQNVVPDAVPRGQALPLIILSHGSGSAFWGHADTALALAGAGFIVAAPTHSGDNVRDGSGATDLAGRTRHLASVVAHVATDWRPGAVDIQRIGGLGFSAGAFTVLAVAGGSPDLTRIGPHCAANPGFYDCRLMARGGSGVPPVLARSPYPLRALVIAAPALGFTFGPGTLSALTMPVQLWQAGEDAILPAPFYAEAVRDALPTAPEFRRVPGAGHFDFLSPCSPVLERAAPAICASAPGFDRAAFHANWNAALVGFLVAALRP